jgi:signal transduction histidine kinase
MNNHQATFNTTDLARSLRVLVSAPVEEEGSLIAAVLRESGMSVSGTPSISALASAIAEGAGAAVVTEEVLHDETVPGLAQQLASQPPWSDFPIIVLIGRGMAAADAELAVRSRAPLGNVVFLERPIRPVILTSAVRSALAARQRQYEIRDHLLDRKQAEGAMRQAHDALESVVEQRTAALRRLSARLLRVQDEERRHVARELHDSPGQYLIAAKINLDLFSGIARPDSNYLRDAQLLIERAISDMRTLSHLLHPPLLDEAGFSSAARWYVDVLANAVELLPRWTFRTIFKGFLLISRRHSSAFFRRRSPTCTAIPRPAPSKCALPPTLPALPLPYRTTGRGSLRMCCDAFARTPPTPV